MKRLRWIVLGVIVLLAAASFSLNAPCTFELVDIAGAPVSPSYIAYSYAGSRPNPVHPVTYQAKPLAVARSNGAGRVAISMAFHAHLPFPIQTHPSLVYAPTLHNAWGQMNDGSPSRPGVFEIDVTRTRAKISNLAEQAQLWQGSLGNLSSLIQRLVNRPPGHPPLRQADPETAVLTRELIGHFRQEYDAFLARYRDVERPFPDMPPYARWSTPEEQRQWKDSIDADLARGQLQAPITDDPTLSDEFVGPFPSWTNVKTAYGAVGDGSADDTAALQQSLTELGTQGHSPVLFLPSGTYRITRTLTLAYTLNISVVGEDPAMTTIVWDGEAGGTMLTVNGVAYSRFTRLTLDGKRRASIAVEQSWDNSRPHFDTGNEYADDRFIDVEYGIHGGFKGYGFAEISIVRSHFVRNTVAGVALGNFNALDVWLWHSRFEDCALGVTNGSGAGNFHVYSSVFQRSTSSDLAMGNTGVFSARGNYSNGSQAFFVSVLSKASPATIHLQRNTIVDPVGPTPIDLKNQGPGVLSDNVIRMARASGPAIRWNSFSGADITSIGNTFTIPKPIENNGRLIAVSDRILAPAAVTIDNPVLPGTPTNHRRPTFEVAPGTRARDIQNTIDLAARQRGKRPVVHFPHGVYSIDETLTIPASDVQMVGDGYGTVLRWTGASSGPLLRLTGPSQATIRELQLDGSAKADGLVVEDADQVGARVYLDQLQVRAGRQTDVFVNGLDHTTVELRDFGHAYSPTATSVKVVGGPLLSAGQTAAAKTNIFSGASSGNNVSYEVTGGARLLLRDLWYEAGAGPGFANIHDSAVFTADGVRIASPPNKRPPAFNIVNLRGRAAIVASNVDDRIALTGNGGAAQVLGLAIFALHDSTRYFANDTSPVAPAALLNSRHSPKGNRSIATPNIGAVDTAFIEMLMKHTRAESPSPPTALPAGITDVRIFRVWVANGVNNITLAR